MSVCLENAGLFEEKLNNPAIFFALGKKRLTTGMLSLTILIKNRKTPQLLRGMHSITEKILQNSQLLQNIICFNKPKRGKTTIIKAQGNG